ncbi:uncharacterized protein LOC113311509 [Papaver somniferum]|uniref:uncharacterized protein LOC113311509 n=1 Tax=Papaver somniferum TaxID=3469 RepID=UPI000E6FE1A6|nr:uncharacterized protein LOC113311509 [Papaver somniferum]
MEQVIVVGLDDSEQSYYALEETIGYYQKQEKSENRMINKERQKWENGSELFPEYKFKIVVVHAKHRPNGQEDLQDQVDILEKRSEKIINRAKEICSSRSVANVQMEVIEGEPGPVLCDATMKHKAKKLVVGCRGLGSLSLSEDKKWVGLGSVSFYCVTNCKSSRPEVMRKVQINNSAYELASQM